MGIVGLQQTDQAIAAAHKLMELARLDLLTGLLIAAPVFWTFTKFLAINLPGLTNSGWI